ncbi:MAG: GNAT family N-acetyltransferase [Labilithrix sp.]|nr:GNAT family N-acetyltransferase [Labilithrix sp.]
MTRVEPLTEAHLPRLRALFDASSSSCFCRYWHFAGTKNDWLDRCANRPEENAAELEAAVRSGSAEARGLVAVDDEGAIVGWMKLAPRDAVPKLRALPVYRSLALGDGATTFSVGCFLVRPDARGKGVARALLEAAPRLAREWGARALEAYPRRSSEPLHAEEAWQGPERVYIDAGFEPIVDVAPYPVYRKTL